MTRANGQTKTAVGPLPSLRFVPSAGLLQRKCACGNHASGGECASCREEREKTLQRTAVNSNPISAVPPIVNEVLRSPGQPLDAETRAFMELRFAHDFSQVQAQGFAPQFTCGALSVAPPNDRFEQEAEFQARRIALSDARPLIHKRASRGGYDFSLVRTHSDAKAAESARQINALAYTVGRDIVFAEGQFTPQTASGRHLLAHELTHVVQQRQASSGVASPLKMSAPTESAENEPSSTADGIHDEHQRPAIDSWPSFAPLLLQRLCSPAATCAAPVAGSVEEFRAASATVEVGPRARRKRMTPARAIATGHSGRALQLEKFLEAQLPGRLAHVQGIFIDWDMDAAAMIQDCAAWISDALPAGSPTPPGMAGATKRCMFVPGPLNPQALAFNTTTSARIGGKPREEWRVSTLQDLTHEVEHVVFNTAVHPTPPGITTATCTRANIGDTLSEMAAFISEFPIVFRAIPAGADAAHPMRQRMADWFEFVLKDAANNFKGMLESMGCQCECAEVDKFVTDTFNFESVSWSAAEKNAFHTELRRPVWGLRWPLAPGP